MWILPKNLITSPFVQDTAGLTWDLQELSKECEPSLTVKSNFTQSKTWYQRWKKDYLNQPLSGRILKPSHSQIFVEQWILSVGAFHANLFPLLDANEETLTQDTYSLSSKEELSNVGLPLFSWKMLEESLTQSYKVTNGQTQREHRFCSMSVENWKELVTSLNGDCSQREKQGCHILGIECLSWEQEEILKILNLKSFPSTYKTILKSCLKHTPIKKLIWNKESQVMIRQEISQVIQPSYYKDLLDQLQALKQSNPNLLPTQAEETEINNSMNHLEPWIEEQIDEMNWHTPTKSESVNINLAQAQKRQATREKGIPRHLQRQMSVSHQVAIEENKKEEMNWNTPMKGDIKQVPHLSKEYIEKRIKNQSQMGTISQVFQDLYQVEDKNWVTPTKSDLKDIMVQTPMKAMKDGTERDGKITRQVHLQIWNQIHNTQEKTFTELRAMNKENPKQNNQVINPRWVEMLMGLPIGWTMRDCATVFQVSLMK